MERAKQLADIHVRKAKQREDPDSPCGLHAIDLLTLISAGADVQGEPNETIPTGFKTTVKYQEIIFWCVSRDPLPDYVLKDPAQDMSKGSI